jgi:hypothetical protein
MEKYLNTTLKDLRTKDGYVVTIEGDSDLYEFELAEFLNNNCERYILLNNIYNNPQKLYELKNIKIDAFIVQTTGLSPKLETLIDLYIKNINNFPKHFIVIFSGSENYFYKIFNELEEYNIYNYDYVDNSNMHITRQDHSCKTNN